MSLLDETSSHVRQRGPRCGVYVLCQTLADPVLTEVRELIDALSIPATVVSRTLRAHEMRVSGEIIARHRAGDCLCR